MEDSKNLLKEPELKSSPSIAPDLSSVDMRADSVTAVKPEIAAANKAPEAEIDSVTSPTPSIAPDAPLAGISAASSQARRSRSHRFALLAASLALAGAVGAMLGALGSAGIMRFAMAPQSVSQAAPQTPIDNTRFDKTTAQLHADIVALRGLVETTGKTATAQFTRMNERIEKAQSDPAAKLSQISAALERLERHAGMSSASATPAATPASVETTGSIKQSVASNEAKKPALLQGWTVRDMYDGRALIEGRQGTLFEVGPGSNLPGLGRIEFIKRQDNQWVVVTPKGVIASAIGPRSRY